MRNACALVTLAITLSVSASSMLSGLASAQAKAGPAGQASSNRGAGNAHASGHSRHRRHPHPRHHRGQRRSKATARRLERQSTRAARHRKSSKAGAGPSTSGSTTAGSTATTQISASVAFSPTSPWNVPIPASPALDPNSASIAGYLGSEMKGYADLYEFGTPIWEASASDPLQTVSCTEPWGTCELAQQPIQIPATAEASSGSDGAMVVIDSSTHMGYDFWRASRTSPTSWSAAWGTRFEMDGSGTGGGATGAGVPLLAGVARLAEMAQGHIDHALGFSSDDTCSSVYRYPASKTDGRSTQTDCIPEGARIQLDPSIDVNAIPGITPGEKIVAHALQTYGAYCKDTGGATMAFGFEDPIGKPNPYPALGFSWDYYGMPHIPWNRLRVLSSWNGS